VTFVVAGLASMGMPGFSGFIAELQVLIGAWKAFPTFAVLGGLGVLIGVAYTLRAVQKAFFTSAADQEGSLALARPHPGQEGNSSSPRLRPQPQEREHSRPAAGGHGTARHQPDHGLEPISVPERIGAAILIATTLLIGLYPKLLLDLIVPALNSPLMEKLTTGGNR